MILSPKIGLTKRGYLTLKPRSLQTGMRMRHTKFPMKRPKNLKVGWMTNPKSSLTLIPKNLRSGMMRKMVIGLLLPLLTPSARRHPDVVNGNYPRSPILSSRASGTLL